MKAREWFKKAQTEGWAVGAFNVDNLEILKAVCIAGQRKKSPVMVEFSGGEVEAIGLRNIIDLVKNARVDYGIPILLNLDHAKSAEDCLAAINIGGPSTFRQRADRSGSSIPSESTSFDDVHFDGSELPLEENLEKAKKVVSAAHLKDILVEGEIDHVPGVSEVHSQDLDLEKARESYTKPEMAAEFIKKTGVDIFAAVFGNVHGTFPNQPDLDFELLEKIRDAVGDTFISLHGGSGIPAIQVREAIKIGKIVKVNVNTEIRAAFHDALVEELGEDVQNITYYKMTPDIINAVAAVVEGKIDVFGSEGKA